MNAPKELLLTAISMQVASTLKGHSPASAKMASLAMEKHTVQVL